MILGIESGATTRLYLITPPQLFDKFAGDLDAALAGGDVACLQLRLKDAGDAEIRRAAASSGRSRRIAALPSS